MSLSRWRALRRPDPSCDPAFAWVVQSEAGALAPEPHTFPTYGGALSRSDALNRAEQYAALDLPIPR